MFKKILRGVAEAIVPAAIAIAVPQSMINTAVMGGLKHGTKLNNNAIPFVNLLLSTAISYGRYVLAGQDPVASILPAVQEGGLLMAASTGLHQSLKIPMKQRTEKSL